MYIRTWCTEKMFQIIIAFRPVFNSPSLSSSSAGLVRGISLSQALSSAACLLSHQNSQTSKFFTFVKLVSIEKHKMVWEKSPRGANKAIQTLTKTVRSVRRSTRPTMNLQWRSQPLRRDFVNLCFSFLAAFTGEIIIDSFPFKVRLGVRGVDMRLLLRAAAWGTPICCTWCAYVLWVCSRKCLCLCLFVCVCVSESEREI